MNVLGFDIGGTKCAVTAAQVAKALGVTVLSLTGEQGGLLKEASDCCIRVPRSQTYQVQALHLPVYHYLCAAVESHFFPE